MDYIDNYSSCERTYATFIVYTGNAKPEEISEYFGLDPSNVSRTSIDQPKKVNGWFLSSKDYVTSKDSRRHIDWLLDALEPISHKLLKLQQDGLDMGIFCFWESSTGNGGPIISTKQMKRLALLELDVAWDVWFPAQPNPREDSGSPINRPRQ